ncbi:MAG: Rab family GTPase [Promethearchaeota archaeon]
MFRSKTDLAYKICLFGNKQVGKSSLVNRFVANRFEFDLKPTIGAAIFVKTFELHDKVIKLQIWDFGGEERFHFLLKSYAYGSFGGIFMFDITNAYSLNEIYEWISIFRDSLDYNFKEAPILLVGGKLDLEKHRIFASDDIKSYLISLKLFDYIECSSKTGENVNFVFETIVSKIIETFTFEK